MTKLSTSRDFSLPRNQPSGAESEEKINLRKRRAAVGEGIGEGSFADCPSGSPEWTARPPRRFGTI